MPCSRRSTTILAAGRAIEGCAPSAPEPAAVKLRDELRERSPSACEQLADKTPELRDHRLAAEATDRGAAALAANEMTEAERLLFAELEAGERANDDAARGRARFYLLDVAAGTATTPRQLATATRCARSRAAARGSARLDRLARSRRIRGRATPRARCKPGITRSYRQRRSARSTISCALGPDGPGLATRITSISPPRAPRSRPRSPAHRPRARRCAPRRS
jgi:hypothetical protein